MLNNIERNQSYNNCSRAVSLVLFFLFQDDMVIEIQKPGLSPPSTTFPVKTAKDPPICTSPAIVEIATKRTKTENGR